MSQIHVYKEVAALAALMSVDMSPLELRIQTALSAGMVNPRDVLRYAMGPAAFDVANVRPSPAMRATPSTPTTDVWEVRFSFRDSAQPQREDKRMPVICLPAVSYDHARAIADAFNGVVS